MAFEYTPTYVSWADFKEQTTVPAMANIGEPAFKLLARRAELLIDSFCGVQPKYEFNQLRLFPRFQDSDLQTGFPYIPEQIVMATILIIEALHLYGQTKNPGTTSYLSERIGDYSYQKAKSTFELFGADMIPSEAHQYLMGFRRRSVQISPPIASDNGNLNSRQKFAMDNY